EVLKDAASAAIYGTRAAGGVILITTKKGQQGKVRVNYNGYFGASQPENILTLLNATQYAVLRNESSVAAGNGVSVAEAPACGTGTDGHKAIFTYSPPRHCRERGIGRADPVSTFRFSGGTQSREGIVTCAMSRHDKLNFRLNSAHQLSANITFGQT